MLVTAEIVPLTTASILIASELAMRAGVDEGLQQVVGMGKSLTACLGRRQTCAPESMMAPGMSTSRPPHGNSMVMRISRRGWALKEAFAAVTKGGSKGVGSTSNEFCFANQWRGN